MKLYLNMPVKNRKCLVYLQEVASYTKHTEATPLKLFVRLFRI